MKKVRTTLAGLHGSSLSVDNQKIEFDGDGVASVPNELADKLISEHPQTYYLDGKPAPSQQKEVKAAPLDPTFAEKFENGAVAKTTTPAELTEDQMEKQIEEMQAKLAAKKQAAAEKEEADLAAAAAGKKEDDGDVISAEQQAKNEAVRTELAGVETNAELKELLKSGGVAAKKYKNVDDREQLIAIIIEHDIIDVNPE